MSHCQLPSHIVAPGLSSAPLPNLPVDKPTLESTRPPYYSGEIERKEIPTAPKCGTYRWTTDPLTGSHKRFRMFCGKWRDWECMDCFRKRVREYQERLSRAQKQHKVLHTILMGEKQSAKYIRTLRKNKVLYLRFPTNIGDYIIFVPWDSKKCLPNMYNISDLQWDILVNSPWRTHPSGRLGMEKKEEKSTEGKTKIAIPVLEITAPGYIKKDAWLVALDATKSLSPKTAKEAEAACKLRLDAFAAELRRIATIWEHEDKDKSKEDRRKLVVFHAKDREEFVSDSSIDWNYKLAKDDIRTANLEIDEGNCPF